MTDTIIHTAVLKLKELEQFFEPFEVEMDRPRVLRDLNLNCSLRSRLQ